MKSSQTEPLGTSDALLETIVKFRRLLALYTEAVLIIRDKDAKMVPLVLNKPQLITHNALTKQLMETGRIRAVILKARQEGISTYVAARFFRAIHLWPGIVAMVVADSLERAEKIFAIYARYREHLPEEIAPKQKSHQRGRYLAFRHDSEISVRPSSDTEAGRAQTLHRLHASELAYWGTGSRDTWTSLMQAVPDKGSEVIVESTAKGAGGLFHELWEAAEQGESGWLAIFLPWWIYEDYEFEPDEDMRKQIMESPDEFETQAIGDGILYRGDYYHLSARKLAWRRQTIIEKFGGDPQVLGKDAIREFQREYPATAEEAFLVSGSCFFDEDILRKMAHRVEDPKIRGRLVLDGYLKDGKTIEQINVDRNPRGAVRIWEYPSKEGHYVIGADTATGKEVLRRRSEQTSAEERGGRDYSSAIVLKLAEDEQPAKVVAELHGWIVPEVFAEQLRLLGKYYSCGGRAEGTYGRPALLGVEQSHSSGQTVLRLLREHYHYNNVYWHREINRLTRKIGRRIGWRTDAVSRMPMLDDLGKLIRGDVLETPSKDMVREMVTFVLWPDGRPAGEEGCHDDRVIALGIANQMVREHRHTMTDPPPVYVPENTMTG